MSDSRLKDLPALSFELLTALEKLYPHRCIEPGETLEQAHRRAGRRELIDSLLDLQKATEERASRKNREVLSQ